MRIVVTPGEPAGIGPDLIIQLAQRQWPVELVVITDPILLEERAKQLRLPLVLEEYHPQKKSHHTQASHLKVLPVTLTAPVVCGELNAANSPYVLNSLTRAAIGCAQGEFAALVTCPVHKGIINQAGFTFSGHTEFFAELTNTSHVVMLLATPAMRVALATTHLALRDVANAITPSLLKNTLTVLQQGLQDYFGFAKPRIAVCGLNPHAGEGGHLGREEIEIITPVLNELRQQGFLLTGPLSADTIFTSHPLTKADAILAMYHDQGLPVLKYSGFHRAVNITLGLPFIRTSVDHGTALELAGSGQANAGSLIAALSMAMDIAARRKI